jgi:HK97 family phage major capsid protein
MSEAASEVVNYLKSEVTRLVNESKSLLRQSEDESRDLSTDEKARIAHNQEQIALYKTRIQEKEDRKALEDAITNSGIPAVKENTISEPASMGEAFVRSPGYKQMMASGGPRGEGWSTTPIEIGRKLIDAGLNVVSIGDSGGSLPLQPQVTPIVGPVETPLVLANLFAQGQASQNTIVYLEETTTTPGVLSERYSDSDATVDLTSEGEAKPAAFINFTKRQTTLDKLAAFLPVADEMLEDEPQIASYINGRLPVFIRQAEDRHLMIRLLASNIGGPYLAASIGTAGNWFDAIAKGILEVQLGSGLNPDAVLMNPADFWTMSVSKSAGDGNYFGGSPYSAASRNPWGIQVAVSNAVATGTAIVGAFREGATVWRKGGITVAASNSHSDFFRKNLTAIRAEERIGLTVYRPGGFARVQK